MLCMVWFVHQKISLFYNLFGNLTSVEFTSFTKHSLWSLWTEFWIIFYIYNISGSEPVPAGKPGKQKKRPVYPTSGSLIEDWHMCVKNLTVSTRENQAHKLIEGTSGYWQSAGSQGKVHLYV